jgi:hypothetical protein
VQKIEEDEENENNDVSKVESNDDNENKVDEDSKVVTNDDNEDKVGENSKVVINDANENKVDNEKQENKNIEGVTAEELFFDPRSSTREHIKLNEDETSHNFMISFFISMMQICMVSLSLIYSTPT